MKRLFLQLLVIFVLFSCSEKKPAANPQVLLDADIAFSDYSVNHGMQKAFIEFAHDSVVLLKSNHMPIVGKQDLVKSYEGKSDNTFVLTWKPAKAVIAESGDLGYTYGFWTFTASNETSHGTYLTVWKKDFNGKWKYIADTGNEGLAIPTETLPAQKKNK
jgi:ketosteroid isomerase-like protein